MADDWLSGGLDDTSDDWLSGGLETKKPTGEVISLPDEEIEVPDEELTTGVEDVAASLKKEATPTASLFGTTSLLPIAPIFPGQMEYLFQEGLISPKDYTMNEAGQVVRKDTLEPDKPLAVSPKNPVHTMARNVFAAHEAGAALASGVLLYLPSKAYGLMALPWGRDAADMAEEYIAAMGYQPRSVEGQVAGDLMQKGFETFLYPSKKAGETVSKRHPRLGYLVQTGAELAQFALTGKVTKGVKNIKDNIAQSRVANSAQMELFDNARDTVKANVGKYNELIKDEIEAKSEQAKQESVRHVEPMLAPKDWPREGKLTPEYARRYEEGISKAKRPKGKEVETPYQAKVREIKERGPGTYVSQRTNKPFKTKASSGVLKKKLREDGIETEPVQVEGGWALREKVSEVTEIPELTSTEQALDFGRKATKDQLKVLADERVELLSESSRLAQEGKLDEAMVSATQAQLRREAIEAATEKKTAVVEVDKDIPAVDRVEPGTIKPEESPFFENRETVEIQKKLYNDPQRAASIASDPEIYTMKLVNDVNRWYYGEDVPIDRVRKGLRELSDKADELWQLFDSPSDHRAFRDMVQEASLWAEKSERPKTETSDVDFGIGFGNVFNLFGKDKYDVYVEDPISRKPLVKFRIKPGGRHKWNYEALTLVRKHREVVETEEGISKIQPGKFRAETRTHEVSGYIIEGLDRDSGEWIWTDTADSYQDALSALGRWSKALDKKRRSIMLKAGVDPTEAFAAVGNMYKRLREVKKTPVKERSGKLYRLIKRKFIDPSANIKVDLVKKFGEQGYRVVERKNLARGANARAARIYMRSNRTIYGKMNRDDQRLLDQIIFSRRVIQIDNIHGEGKKKHPFGLGGKAHAAYLEEIKRRDSKKFEELMRRADMYFDLMRDQLKQLYDEGLLTDKDYEALRNFDYSRRQLIDILDPSYTFKVGTRRETVRDSGVQELAKGRDSDALETDSNLLMLEVINRTQGRIMSNRANQALLELARANPDNPFARIPVKGQTKVPRGWGRIEVFEAGKKKSIYMPQEFAKEWVKQDVELSYNMANMMRILSGSTILRPMATGINVGFAFANLPRDLFHIWLTSQVYRNGKWQSSYSSFVPLATGQMTRDLSTTFSDALLRRGRYDKYIEEGGGMEFLVHQGRILKKRLGAETKLDKVQNVLGYINETSEIMSRLALRERIIRQEANARGISMEAARKNTDITTRATGVAREYMDFGGYGGITKAVDSAIPYLGASVEGTRGIFRSAVRDPKSFVVKSAQLGMVATGLYLANKFNNPECLEAVSPQVANNNFVITTPWSFVDSEGQTRHIYFTVPKDPGQRFMTKFFEYASQKAMGEDVDADQVVATLKDLSPVTEANLLPPSGQSFMGYALNKDFWLNEDIWRGPKVEPSEEYKPGQTSQAMIDIGQTTGLSPERLRYSLERLFTSGNLYSHMVGYGYEKLFSNMPKDQREQHLAMILSQTPVARRFIKVTNPYNPYAKTIDDVTTDVNTQRWIRTRELDRLTDGYLFKDNVQVKEIVDYIKKVKVDEGTEEAKRLFERFKFQKKVKDLPNRTFWLVLQRTSAEARAQIFKKRWDQSDAEQRKFMKVEMRIIGKGVFSDRFFEEYKKLVP